MHTAAFKPCFMYHIFHFSLNLSGKKPIHIIQVLMARAVVIHDYISRHGWYAKG